MTGKLYQYRCIWTLERRCKRHHRHTSPLSPVPYGMATTDDNTTEADTYWDISTGYFVSSIPLYTDYLYHLLIFDSVCIVSILRVTSFDYSNLGDGTYKNIEPATWSSIEQSVGIICACLPTLRPFFRWLYGTSRKSTRNRDSAMSEFPKQTPLACRTYHGDEENALGLVNLPAERQVSSSQGNKGKQREYNRPISQETSGSSISQNTFDEQPGTMCLGLYLSRNFLADCYDYE